MKHNKRRLLTSALAGAALAGYLWWGNSSIMVTELPVAAAGLPEEFSGYRIAQVSDLHNAQFGEHNRRLLEKLADARPDVIVLTGDLIDSRRTDVAVSLTFARGAAAIAPTYYVPGNHESRDLAVYEQLKTGLTDAGVRVLENEAVSLTRGEASITLAGILDNGFGDIQQPLLDLFDGLEGYTVLLSHRPENAGYYAGAGADLVFTGHAHGGQFRIPFVGGVLAPGQGFLPTYDSGLYQVENTQMIVSRGLGNSAFPFRLNNRPEIVVAELNRA